MSYVKPFLRRASRRRPISKDENDVGEGACSGEEENFKKCLSTPDLVSLGVGSCCGAGMYLTVGLVSRGAGLGACLSFIVAGFGSMLSGLCYAELAALCPRTSGSAYMYSYVTVGELVAFVIGWGLLVEYAIGTAAGAVALSAAINTMTNYSYGKTMTAFAGAFLGRPYFDAIAVAICLTLTLVLTAGVKLSATFNNILNFINLLVFIFFSACALLLARPTMLYEDNGFFPQGIWAAIKEIPTAYFAFIGFDIVATTGEEAKNPSKSIPKSIWISVLINTFAYVTVTIAINNVLPYFTLKTNSAMIFMLAEKGWVTPVYIVSVGAVCALFAATFGSLFPLPRVLYAMAKDGLICRQFAYICPSRKTPKLATVVSGCIAAVVSVTVDLDTLIELVLLGTLLAYVLVAVCVLITRYAFDVSDDNPLPSKLTGADSEEFPVPNEHSNGFWEKPDSDIPLSKKLKRLLRRCPTPGQTLTTGELALLVTVLVVSEILFCILIQIGESALVIGNGRFWIFVAMTPFLLIILLVMLIFMRLPQNVRKSGFRVPAVPLLPVLVTFFNIYLMTSLNWVTWCMFIVWMVVGFVVYLYYTNDNGDMSSAAAEEDRRPLLATTETTDKK